MVDKQSLFKELAKLNVNEYVEQKNGLNYLSWANAIQEICRQYDEDFDYEIEKFGESNLPYVYDNNVGFMVFTKITLCGKTREMWLPVMDNNNNAMLKEQYTYKVKKYEYNKDTRRKEFNGEYEEKQVEKATMFDVNKAIMRCLVKNLAMFGLGLYIYSGEDLPIEFDEPCTAQQLQKIKDLAVNEKNVLLRYKIRTLEELTFKQAEFIIASKQKSLKENKGE